MPFRKSAYPSDWKTIRARILARAGGHCEECGVADRACGWRDAEGKFHPTAGNETHDAAGRGELCYKEAQALVRQANESGGLGPNGERGIVIVLTIAHLKDPDPHNTAESNLAALCQYDHLALDKELHRRIARWRRAQRRQQLQPALPGLEEERRRS